MESLEPEHEAESPDAQSGRGSPRAWYVNWRFWLGIAIAGLSIGYVARGIPLKDVFQAMGRANLLLLFAVSVPSYLVATWVRALRWRHLVNPVAEIPRDSLFRAQALGFMVNNLLPLRVGEFVRSWFLARQNNVSATSILGTVVIERVIDVVSVLLIAAGSLAWAGRGGESLLAQGAMLLLPVACLPVMGLLAIRRFPGQVLSIARFFARPLPARVGSTLERLLGSFTEGLQSLTLGTHLAWILFHTVVIWLVLSTIPIVAGLYAFELNLATPAETLMLSWILLAAVGVAVAIPSAPGFFGTYQLAFSSVLERFDVTRAEALAAGLLIWFVFWITLVALGMLVLRSQRTSLGELALHASKDPATESR